MPPPPSCIRAPFMAALKLARLGRLDPSPSPYNFSIDPEHPASHGGRLILTQLRLVYPLASCLFTRHSPHPLRRPVTFATGSSVTVRLNLIRTLTAVRPTSPRGT